MMAKIIYALIKIKVEVEEADLRSNESKLVEQTDSLESAIEQLFEDYPLLTCEIVPEWEDTD